MIAPELLAAAREYHENGFAVIPFFIDPNRNPQTGIHDKTPKINEYKMWNERPQTDEEFNNLKWEGCNGFGIILGQKSKDGRYLAVIDFDPKQKKTKKINVDGKFVDVPITAEDIEHHKLKILIAEKILADFPTTKIELTVNYGKHLFLWSKTQPEIDSAFHDETLIELLGNKKLCVIYPSYGYQNIASDIIAEVEDVQILFNEIHKKHGWTKKEQTEVQNQIDSYSFKIEKLIDLKQLTDNEDGTYTGSHPIHGSTGGKNFSVDTTHNQWHCFRHSSGGGALQYLAMKEGIISCEQAKKGALRGKKFEETLKLAVAQGLVKEEVLDQSEINPTILAKDIMQEHIFVVDKETDELYYYVKSGDEEGIYSNQTEQLIRREIVARLDEDFKARYKTEVTEFIKGTAPLVQMGNKTPELIALKNGMLRTTVKDGTVTHTLEKYDSNHYITNKLPVIYQPTDSHVWKDFIAKIVPNEKQRRQLQQLIGHCLYGKILTEICVVLLGTGSNGKTITLQIITKFLGDAKNVSSHSIQQLCYDKFVTGEVKGKLANICADLPHKELANTSIFKALVSGDSMQAYVKHVQKTVAFLPTTKYIFSANQIPPVANEEDCYAWYRRFVFVDFPLTFTKKNSTPRQELLNSLSSPEVFSEILNWSLEGLDYLLLNGDISDKPTTEEVRLIYIKKSDSALAYFADKVKCTDNPEDYVFTDQFHRDYVTYCHINDLKPKTQGDFVNTVKNHLPGAEKTRIRPDDAPKSSSALSAFRYIKVDFVPRVLDVPTSKNKSQKLEKNQQLKFSISDELFTKRSTPSTVGTKSEKQELHIKRLAPNEPHICGNPNCEGNGVREAAYENTNSDNGKTLYICESCLNELKPKLIEAGIELVEDLPYREDA